MKSEDKPSNIDPVNAPTGEFRSMAASVPVVSSKVKLPENVAGFGLGEPFNVPETSKVVRMSALAVAAKPKIAVTGAVNAITRETAVKYLA